MDPDETLRQLRQLVISVTVTADTGLVDLTEDAENLATLFGALDDWLAAGGFSPAAWRRA